MGGLQAGLWRTGSVLRLASASARSSPWAYGIVRRDPLSCAEEDGLMELVARTAGRASPGSDPAGAGASGFDPAGGHVDGASGRAATAWRRSTRRATARWSWSPFCGAGGDGHTLAHVTSALGYPAYYPLHPGRAAAARQGRADGPRRHERAQRALLDLDHRADDVASLLGDPGFELEAADLPFVSGHSVSEHLQYCIASTARSRRSRRRGATTSSTRTARCRPSWRAAGRPMLSCPRRG